MLNVALITPDGQTVQATAEGTPIMYLYGAQQAFPTKVEQALEGRSAGDEMEIDVPAAEAFGMRNEQAVQKVPRQAFQGVEKIEPGMQFQARGPDGQQAMVIVVDVDDQFVTVDGNHPLAGVDVRFKVRIVEVREPSSEELAHGHVHGPGGHHHGEGQSEASPVGRPPEPPRQSRTRR